MLEEKVISCEYIDNVYDELVNLNEKGLIKLYLYPSRPNEVPLDNSDLIPKIIRWQRNGFNIDRFYDLYPELREKLSSEMNDIYC